MTAIDRAILMDALTTLKDIRKLVEERKVYNQFDGIRSIGVNELEAILNKRGMW